MFFFQNLPTDLIVLLGILYVILRLYYNYCFKYWKNLGIPYLKPTFPLGNSLTLFPKYGIPGTVTVEFYKKVKKLGYKYAGIYLRTSPNLVIVDPDLIKNIIVKDFEHFADRGMYVVKHADPLSSQLFSDDAPDWRPMRTKLTPTFTSGKMKIMFKLMYEVSNYMIDYLNNQQEFEAKKVMRFFTIDVIGICAFGITCNSFKDPDAEFVKTANRMSIRSPYDRFRLFFINNFRNFSQLIGIPQSSKYVRDFFYKITKETIESRKENDIKRGDFIHMLIDIRNKLGEDTFTIDNMVAQTFLFFVAGFDTSSTALSFALYELARNQDCQEKLRRDINETLEKTNGQITYESLTEMKYLQMVIDETLRLYPSVPSINRRCTKDYIIPGTNHLIERGVPILISLLGLHKDPEYWDDPDKFDPERFSDENKQGRHPYVHLPFGTGPRNCIGSRFGLMQTRLGLVRIIKDFKLELSPKTKPVELDTLFLLASKDPIHLKIEKITKN